MAAGRTRGGRSVTTAWAIDTGRPAEEAPYVFGALLVAPGVALARLDGTESVALFAKRRAAANYLTYARGIYGRKAKIVKLEVRACR